MSSPQESKNDDQINKLRLRKVLEESFDPINHEQNSFDSISESFVQHQNSKNLADQQETLLNHIVFLCVNFRILEHSTGEVPSMKAQSKQALVIE